MQLKWENMHEPVIDMNQAPAYFTRITSKVVPQQSIGCLRRSR